MIIPEYFGSLIVIRKVLEKELHKFPYNQCQHTARILSRVLALEEIAGNYISIEGKERWHAWNYDPELRLYIDLTQDQYLHNGNEITILPKNTQVLQEIPKRTKSQKELEVKEFESEVDRIVNLLSNKDVF